jgi:4-oxalocrotonate tautomerase
MCRGCPWQGTIAVAAVTTRNESVSLGSFQAYSHKRRFNVPLVQVKLIAGVFSSEQKRQMIEKLTDTMVSIEGENMRGVTSVIVEEVRSGDWGIGGKALTTDDVNALRAGR